MLLSRLDSFGLPLCEGTEIEVKFMHKGRPAKAVFDVWAKYEPSLYGQGKDFIDGQAEFVAAEFTDTEEAIPSSDLLGKVEDLEDEAFEIYGEMQESSSEVANLTENADSDVIRTYLDKARKQIKMAIDHVRSMESGHDPKSHASAKIRGSKHALIEVEKVLVSALAKAEGMLDKIKRL